MVFIAAFRHRHSEQQVYGYTVNGVERNGFFQTNECSLDVTAALDPAMRNSDASAKPGAAQALPCAETFKNFSLAQNVTVAREFFADGFQQSLFAAGVHIAEYSFRAEQVT